MDSMFVEIDARIAAGEDFDLGGNANPYPRSSAAWRYYESEYQELVGGKSKAVKNGSKQTQ